jgi:hypothetical protein
MVPVMNEKKVKALRKALCPPKSETGMSRGAFMRLLTRYEQKIYRRSSHWWPLAELFGPFVVDYYTQTLNKDCPRALVKQFKELHRARSTQSIQLRA